MSQFLDVTTYVDRPPDSPPPGSRAGTKPWLRSVEAARLRKGGCAAGPVAVVFLLIVACPPKPEKQQHGSDVHRIVLVIGVIQCLGPSVVCSPCHCPIAEAAFSDECIAADCEPQEKDRLQDQGRGSALAIRKRELVAVQDWKC
jgi:hypothetical protein